MVVPILLITLLLAGRVYADDSESYSVSGTELLVAGRGQVSAADQVDLAGVGAALLDELLTGPTVLRQLSADGLSDTFDLELSETGTTLAVEVLGETPEQAVATVERLVELAPELLEESLGERSAQAISVEQAIVGTPEDAAAVGDGRYRFESVIVVGTAPRNTLNPFPASLATVRSLLTIATSPTFAVAVAEQSPRRGASFTVANNVREAPLINVTVEAPSPQLALATHAVVVAELREQLTTLQADAGVEADARTQMLTLVEATYPIRTPMSKVRPVAAIVVLGSGLAIGLATLIEALTADRRRRRGATGGPNVHPDPDRPSDDLPDADQPDDVALVVERPVEELPVDEALVVERPVEERPVEERRAASSVDVPTDGPMGHELVDEKPATNGSRSTGRRGSRGTARSRR